MLEIAADAIRCVNAGATVIHFHARDPETGAPRRGDAALYAEAMRRILVERARHKRSRMAGGGRRRLEVSDLQPAGAGPDGEGIA